MSGYMAYLSFANYLKDKLSGSGITIGIEKDKTWTTPYLLIQDGPDDIAGGWRSARMIQGKLVVSKVDTEPLVVTSGKYLDKILEATRSPGQLEKYDYNQTPKVLIGSVIPSIYQVTGDMSSDPRESRRVITWELYSSHR